MQWYSRIDPETNQVIVGSRTVISTVVAVMIIAFAGDIKSLVIDAETSGLTAANTRQNLEIIANNVTEHEIKLVNYNERILRLEIANEEHLKMQRQIAMNTGLIRKSQEAQTNIVAKLRDIVSDNKTFESRLRREEIK